MSPQGELGPTASAYKVSRFADGMALAWLFSQHPELKGLAATIDQSGHVDIIAHAETGVLRDWIRALPTARHTQDLYTLQSGAAFEHVLIDGSLTVHVRPLDPTQMRGGGSNAARMGLVADGEQGLGTCSSTPSGPPCAYCGEVGGHTGQCPVVS